MNTIDPTLICPFSILFSREIIFLFHKYWISLFSYLLGTARTSAVKLSHSNSLTLSHNNLGNTLLQKLHTPEAVTRSEQLLCSGVMTFSRTDLFLIHSSCEFRPITWSILNHWRPGSLYYHQRKTKKAGSSEDELSKSSGNLGVVSEEDFEV